jgi:hypothetical protein
MQPLEQVPGASSPELKWLERDGYHHLYSLSALRICRSVPQSPIRFQCVYFILLLLLWLIIILLLLVFLDVCKFWFQEGANSFSPSQPIGIRVEPIFLFSRYLPWTTWGEREADRPLLYTVLSRLRIWLRCLHSVILRCSNKILRFLPVTELHMPTLHVLTKDLDESASCLKSNWC